MSAQGIQVYHAPLETSEALRCTQRYGKEGHISDPSQGAQPSQWVLGKTPREAPSLVSEDQFADLGAIEDQVDPESRFAFQHQARLEAKKTFIHLDTSKRVQRALPRSAKPIPQTYSVGDVVCFLGGITSQVRPHGHQHPVSLAMRGMKTKMFGFYVKTSLF